LITHNDAPQSVGLLWTSDQSVAETSTWQHKTLTADKMHAPGGIRNHDLSRRAAVDLRFPYFQTGIAKLYLHKATHDVFQTATCKPITRSVTIKFL